LVGSYEKFILDLEMLGLMTAWLRPPKINAAEIGLDSIRQVGPGGHFFGTAHTLERYRDAFYAPLVSDWSNFETWTERGSLDATQRSARIWKEMLRNFEAPALDPGKREALEDYVARRKREIAAAR